MDILYLVGALVFLVILGYAYFILLAASREKGIRRRIGQILTGLFVAILVLFAILFQSGVLQN